MEDHNIDKCIVGLLKSVMGGQGWILIVLETIVIVIDFHLGNDETHSVLFSFHCRKLGYQSFRESQQKSLVGHAGLEPTTKEL